MTSLRRRALPAALTVLTALTLLAGCGGTKTASQVHVAIPAGPNPSKSAKMVCQSEAQGDIAKSLGVHTTKPFTPTWIDHLYSCQYGYPNGTITLSVKELVNAAATTAYFDSLMTTLGDQRALAGLAQGAFITLNGSVVVRKDYKVLDVDVSQLPAEFGQPLQPRGQVAQEVAFVIIGCWSGD
jgi:hypothetical protein